MSVSGEVIEGFRLSLGQAALWRSAEGGKDRRVGGVVSVDGPLEEDLLRRALTEVVSAHEILRTCPRVMPALRLPLQTVEDAEVSWRDYGSARNGERPAGTLVRRHAAEADPDARVRAGLLRIGPAEHLLVLDLPRLVADPRTVAAVVSETQRAYQALLIGAEVPRPEVQFVQFSEWQHALTGAQDEAAAEAFAYWRRQPLPSPATSLAGWRSAVTPAAPSGAKEGEPVAAPSRRHAAELSPEEAAEIAELARRTGTDEPAVLLAAWGALWTRLGGRDQVVIGTALDGRIAELADAPGPFTTLVPVGISTPAGSRFADLAAEVAGTLAAHAEWQEYAPAVLDAPPDPGYEITFDHVAVPAPPEDEAGAAASAPDGPGRAVRLRLRELTREARPATLHLACVRTQDGLVLEVHCNADQFDPRAVDYVLESYRTLLRSAGRQPSTPVSALPVVGERQLRDRAVVDAVPEPRTFPENFARQAALTPDRVAARHGEDTLTYAELRDRAGALVRRLRAAGVRPESRVALCLRPCLDALVGVVAILTARGVYVPLDPSDPVARRAHILDDASATVVLTDEEHARTLPAGPARVLTVAAPEGPAAPEDDEGPPGAPGPGEAAYVIYTSGTSGPPKGVVVDHGALSRYLEWAADHLIAGLSVPAITRFAFDASLKQLLAPLLRGSEVWLPTASAADPEALYRELATRESLAVNCVPSLWQSLLDVAENDPGGALRGRVKRVLVGGEALPAPLVERTAVLLPGAEIHNLYGPTEATANATAGPVTPGGPVTLGGPVASAELQVLDEHLAPVPVGVPGRLFLGGSGLARGYLGRPGQTAERFVPHPFSRVPGRRLYDTGDLVRFRADGRLEFLGRADLQVKLHGFRVELEGVEAELVKLPGVAAAAVSVRELPAGGSQLVGYVVPADGAQPAPDALRARLAESLPEYQVPAAVAFLDALPLTATGKLDRSALADLAPVSGAGEGAASPRSLALEEVAAIWGRVLGLPRIGRDDNFFALGGHSLLVVQVTARIRDAFGVDLPPGTLFRAPTLHGFAAEVERALTGDRRSAVPPVGRAPRGGAVPLSAAQQRLWILEQLEPGSSRHHVTAARRITGTVDASAVRRALGEVIARHEVLRTGFEATDGYPRQVVHPTAELAFRIGDLTAVAPPERDAEVQRQAERLAAEPMDLRRPPLLRAELLRLAEDDAVLVVVVHHLVCDGWAKAVLFSEFAALYQAQLTGAPAQLPDLPVQYADYSHWQRTWITDDLLDGQLAYWRHQLRDVPMLELPTDRPRPDVPRYRGRTVQYRLTPELTDALRALSAAHGATLFMTTLCAYQVLLARYSGQTDLAIGTPVAHRSHTELENLIGLFVNTVALRADLSDDPTFAELLGRTRHVALEAYLNQDLPFERVVEELRPARVVARTPLFQAMFVFVPGAAAEVPLGPGTVLRSTEIEPRSALFDLTLSVLDEPDGLVLHLNYDADLFDEATAERMTGHLHSALRHVVAAPQTRVSAVPLLTDGEQRQLAQWNDTADPDRPHGRIEELFTAQAARTPSAVAVESDTVRLTYGELDRLSDRLADRLRGLGVGPESRVAVGVARSPELVVTLLAVAKSGGAHVPVDPHSPPPRVAAMLARARPAVVTLRPADADAFTGWSGPVVTVDLDRLAEEQPAEHGAGAPDAPREAATAAHPAYVIYTSGSTGTPKGVVVSHDALVNEVWCMQRRHLLGPDDAVLLKTPLTFDVAVWEFFWPLLYGARVVVTEPRGHLDPQYLARMIRRHRVTTVQFVPTMLRAFLEAGVTGLESLRRVLCIGEALPPDLLPRFSGRFPGVRLHNLYGPAEATVHVTEWECLPGPAGDLPADGSGGEDPGGGHPTVPIGAPIANTTALVLDEHQAPLPVGVTGQLYLGGACLARGYADDPALTAERFVPDPFGAPGARLYATGDLVRRRPDGLLEFVGRADHQVKIRGHRVEPGEVEAALTALAAIREAVVTTGRDSAGDAALVAYFTVQDGGRADVEEVRAALRRVLPDHLVPSAFVPLPDMPRSANGKLDRKALPAPAAQSSRPVRDDAPRGQVEKVLAGLWAQALGTASVGLDDDFFQLGGHSLLMIQVSARVRDELGVELSPLELARAPRLADFAARVSQHLGSGPASVAPARAEDGPDRALSFAEQRFWIIDQLEPGTPVQTVTAAYRVTGAIDPELAQHAVDGLVARHETLRTGYRAADGEPRARVVPEATALIETQDLSGLPPAEREAEAGRRMTRFARRPFDLGRPPLLRAALLRLDENEALLVLGLHHLICDARSLELLMSEFAVRYRDAVAGTPTRLPAPEYRYADFAARQRADLDGPRTAAQLEYWRARLHGLPTLALPTDLPRPAVARYRGQRVRRRLPAALLTRLRALAAEEGVTLHTATLAAFKALLGRYAAQSDVVVGSPVTQRTHTERQEVVGCFVNTVVLRSDLSGDPAFRELLHRVRETVLGAHDHQDLPFERLVEELRPARDRSRAPLFQVMFAYAPLADREIELPGAVLRQVDPDGDTAQFDLRLLAAEEEDGLRLTLTYDRELFERSTAERVLAHLERLLTAVAARPDDPVSAAPLADHAERERTVRAWNDTSAELPGAPFVDLLIAEQSRKTPGAPAVRDDRTVLSYRELDERANRLAHRLRAAGAGPGEVVGVCLPRRTDLVVALLAVLKSGAAYLPLDPAYPEERTRFLLADARPVTVVTQRDLMDRAGATGVTPIRMDGEPEDLAACPDTPPNVPRCPGDPAYVIHTSGSTGTPKGVVVSHRNLARSTAARHQYYPELVKSFLLVSSPAFDSSVAGLFWTLTSGGELILPAPGSERDAGQLAGLVDRHAISHLLAVPSLYRAVLEAAGGRDLSALRTVIVAGERLPSGLVAEHHALLSGTQLFNEYGLTECSVWSSVYRCPKNSPEPVPIGHPIANTALYLLDPRMEPVAVGEVGELHVGGDGVAHGYLGRPGLTAERYLPDPFGARPGGRLYRTGDLARYRSDGALVLVGRSDHQITLRGFRIEPEEIEAVALRHPGVRQAAVVAGDGAAGGPVLGVYLVTDGSVPFELGRFRDHVRRHLPGHMVPAACAVVDHLPCLPNGKVDRRALEPIDPAGNGVRQTPTAPRDPLEERLLELWTELFDGADIGVEHNFFDLGGHSLLALRLLARIEDTLGVSLSLSQFFDTPTVADLACHVEAALGGGPPVNPDDPLPTDAPSADEGSDVRP